MARADRSTTQGEFRAAVSRWSVAAVVPLLAVGAHALAGGELPGTSGAILVAGIGVIAGVLTRCVGALGIFSVLTVAQAASHAVLMMSHGDVWALPDVAAMLVTHVLAVPASALAIVVVAQLVSLITSVLRTLVGPARQAPVGVGPRFGSQPALVGVTAVAQHAIRGPPLDAVY